MSETIADSSIKNDVRKQYRLLHDVYVLMDDGDRKVFEQFDLSPTQFTLLTFLDLEKGYRLTRLSGRSLRAKSTITRIVDHLEERGWVVRIQDPEDRRAQRVRLTQEGLAHRTLITEIHNKSLADRLSILSDDEQQMLKTLLAKLKEGLIEALNESG